MLIAFFNISNASCVSLNSFLSLARLAQNYEQRVKDMDAFLQNTSQGLPEFDDDHVRRLIGNIKVVSTERITIQFKSGIVMEQQLNEEW